VQQYQDSKQGRGQEGTTGAGGDGGRKGGDREREQGGTGTWGVGETPGERTQEGPGMDHSVFPVSLSVTR